MTRQEYQLTIVALALGLVLSVALGTSIHNAWTYRVSRCQEDQVLVGGGDFEDGRWDYYECGPAVDDYGCSQ